MACFIIGAGSFYGLPVPVRDTDTVIAADGGWRVCRELSLTPSLLVADFDSLDAPSCGVCLAGFSSPNATNPAPCRPS